MILQKRKKQKFSSWVVFLFYFMPINDLMIRKDSFAPSHILLLSHYSNAMWWQYSSFCVKYICIHMKNSCSLKAKCRKIRGKILVKKATKTTSSYVTVLVSRRNLCKNTSNQLNLRTMTMYYSVFSKVSPTESLSPPNFVCLPKTLGVQESY